MNEKQKDFYQKIRADIRDWLDKKAGSEHRWSEYILLAPDMFHLLAKLAIDPDVPGNKKAKLIGAITYFISPIDLMPEAFLGPVGYLDDIAIAAYVINDLINEIDPQIVIRNWAGDKDILYLIKNILINADKILGSGLWKKIKRKI